MADNEFILIFFSRLCFYLVLILFIKNAKTSTPASDETSFFPPESERSEKLERMFLMKFSRFYAVDCWS
jgi:hypothetical protein